MWPLVPIDGSDVTGGEQQNSSKSFAERAVHGKVTVDIDTKVADVLYRGNWNAIHQHCCRW